MIVKKCLVCKKEFQTKPSIIKTGGGKYCSKNCSYKNRIGKKLSEEHKQKIRESQLGKPRHYLEGDKHGNWKGNDVCYTGIHHWVERHRGKPKKCENCCQEGRYFYRKNGIKLWNIQWANKSGKYLRDLSDWIGLCQRCHKKYDAQLNSKNYGQR